MKGIDIVGKKWNYDTVRAFVENESECVLLSNKYVRSKDKLKFLCACGNEFEASFDKFKSKNKRQCNECGYKNGGKAMSFTYEEVKQFIEVDSNSGCKLLSKKYNGIDSEIKLKCKCGNEFKTKYRTFKYQGKRQCDKCSAKSYREKRLFSFDYVKNYIENENNSGCKLLSTTYKGDREPLLLKCKCGNNFYTTFSQFKHLNKRQCNACSQKDSSERQKLSYNYVKKYIEIVSDGSLKLLSEDYINNNTKLKLLCSCGEEFETTFQIIQRGKIKCNQCAREALAKQQRLPYSEIKDYIENKHSFWQKLKLISGDYKSANDKLTVKDEDGYKYYITLSNLKTSYGKSYLLPFSVYNKYTIENIHNWIELSGNTNALLSEEFIGNKHKLLWKCSDGHKFRALFNNIRKGHGCPVCAGQSKPSIDFVRQEFEKRDCVLISKKYKNNISKLKYICNTHKDKGMQEIAWGNFYSQGNGCYYCGREAVRKARLKTHKEFCREVYELTGDEYEIIGNYTKSKDPILIKHNSCKTIYQVKPTDFLSGSRCPSCNQSKGEKDIEKYLQKNNVNYQIQYRINECRNINPLPFDFAIFDNNNNLRFLIEYDGEHHFKPIDFAGRGEDWAQNEHEKIKKNDKIKKMYCESNNIVLISIPYWDFDNINKILDVKVLSELNKIKAS